MFSNSCLFFLLLCLVSELFVLGASCFFWGKGGGRVSFWGSVLCFCSVCVPVVFEFASVLVVFEFGLDFVCLFGGRRHVSFFGGVLFVFASCSNSTF